MEEPRKDAPRPVNPRRRKRSRMQIFKESYLPVIIAGIALVLIIVFIAGSISRSAQKRKLERDASIEESVSLQNEQARLEAEAQQLIAQAEALANTYNFEDAIAALDSFSGDPNQFPDILDRRSQYQEAMNQMVAWEDPGQVVNLSFQVLIADLSRALADPVYAAAYNKNYITTQEFSNILSQLYDNGYMLVNLSDVITTVTDDNGETVYTAKTLYLPAGKKPLILTQTNVNYNTYMIDGNGDKLPDKDGAGFASRLMLTEDGSITCEMVDSSGTTVTGDYDLVPILDAFVEEHPDFSYHGAKAILALTGYDGLFGYRTNPGARQTFGDAVYEQQIADATEIAGALRADGYTLACYTYENIAYGDRGVTEVQADLNKWNAEAVPIMGDTDILAFAQKSDIDSGTQSYSGDKFNTLMSAGFRYYLGFCDNGSSWAVVDNDYVRMGRFMVTGSNMAYHAQWFAGIFDTASVLDSARGTVPAS